MPAFIPLGDFVERRRLISLLFVAVAGALVFAAASRNLGAIVAAGFLIGLTTVAAQIMIPLAAELAEPEDQGRTIGAILSVCVSNLRSALFDCDALRQVAWLIDIAAPPNSNVVGEQLQRHDLNQRR